MYRKDELADELEEIGTTWGEQELEVWRDCHRNADGSITVPMPEWTLGTYCGPLPKSSTDPNLQTADARRAEDDRMETAIDQAARVVWERARARAREGV